MVSRLLVGEVRAAQHPKDPDTKGPAEAPPAPEGRYGSSSLLLDARGRRGQELTAVRRAHRRGHQHRAALELGLVLDLDDLSFLEEVEVAVQLGRDVLAH